MTIGSLDQSLKKAGCWIPSVAAPGCVVKQPEQTGATLKEKAMAPTPVLLPGKSSGRRSLGGAVHGVSKSRTRLSNFTFTFHFHELEKAMAAHSSVLAWRIPGTGEPGGLPSMGSRRVGHD